MKAIILSSLVFFSLRAMSADIGEKKKPEDCAATAATEKREAKVVPTTVQSEAPKADNKGIIKK